MRLYHWIIIAGLSAFSGVISARADDQTLTNQLSLEFFRAAQALVQQNETLDLGNLNLAIALNEEAVRLNPHDVDAWHFMMDLAQLTEREELKSKALQQLVKLDPSNDVVALMRLNEAIQQYQTAHERIGVYQSLLSDANRSKLSNPVASRLAQDLALLYQRLGDIEEMGRWLGRAVDWDSSNRSAVALAAGFFRHRSNDPFGEAELLTLLLLADPIDIETQILLAQLLLENGAYEGATRLYQLATQSSHVRRVRPSVGMLTDKTLAEWGSGNGPKALGTINKLQRDFSEQLRLHAIQENPRLSSLELAQILSKVPPALGTIRTAIYSVTDDSRLADSIDAVSQVYQATIDQLVENNFEPTAVAQVYLEMTWFFYWLGNDADTASRWLREAENLVTIKQTAQQRFAGWDAICREDWQQAEDILLSQVEEDPASALGMVRVYEARGQKREAAELLLSVARSKPGTLMAVYALQRLQMIFNQPIILSDTAGQMEQLIESLPYTLDRIPNDPSLALSMRLIPHQTVYAAFDPLMVDIELTNNAPFPLCIDRDGPIQPQIALEPTMSVVGLMGLDALIPIVVDIDRRLCLQPREQLVIPLNLRRFGMGLLFKQIPLAGALLSLKATSNFIATEVTRLRIHAGAMGLECDMHPVRVEGVRVTEEWLDESLKMVAQPDTNEDLYRMSMMSHWLAFVYEKPDTVVGIERAGEAVTTLTEVYSQLSPLQQAWLLSMMARPPSLDPIFTMAQQSEYRLVILSYLMFHVHQGDDPMLLAAQRFEDASIQKIARYIYIKHNKPQQPPSSP